MRTKTWPVVNVSTLLFLMAVSKSVVPGGLNSPCDAKRIGDYTGLTLPFDNDHEADNF